MSQELGRRVGNIEADVAEIKVDVRRLDERMDDLDRHMHVLHEDTIARFAAIPEYTGPSRAEFYQGLAELRELIEQRIVPIETVIRTAIANGKL